MDNVARLYSQLEKLDYLGWNNLDRSLSTLNIGKQYDYAEAIWYMEKYVGC